jgi:hypothetical protein
MFPPKSAGVAMFGIGQDAFAAGWERHQRSSLAGAMTDALSSGRSLSRKVAFR